MTLTELDGQRMFTFTSQHAYGCGGPESADQDEQERSTFVLFGAHADELVEAELGTWGSMWTNYPDSDGTARTLAGQLGGTWPPALTSREPTWGPGWDGTLTQFWEAQDAHRSAVKEHAAAAQASLSWARMELFRRIGAEPFAAYVVTSRELLHDFGCSCGHAPSLDDEDGWSTLRVRDGALYATPNDLTPTSFDEERAQAAVAGDAAHAAAVEKNVQRAARQAVTTPREPHRSNRGAVGELTYPQWLQVTVERSAQVASAVHARNFRALDDLGERHLLCDPDVSRANVVASALRRQSITVFTADEARVIAGIAQSAARHTP